MVPKDATLKLDGKEQKLVNGQFKTQVAKRIRTEIEVDHPLFEIQTHTIQMVEGGIDETFELVSCQKLKNCKPNWSDWGSWKECVPRCYNYPSEISKSTKERTRYYLPDANYSQEDWRGNEKESKQCSNIPECPNDKLYFIQLQNAARSYSSNDDFFIRICNPASCCYAELDSDANDFNSGNLDTFSGTDIDGNCNHFNITTVRSLSVKRVPNGSAEDQWIADYIDLSLNINWAGLGSSTILDVLSQLSQFIPKKRYRCVPKRTWIPADGRWYTFQCNKL